MQLVAEKFLIRIQSTYFQVLFVSVFEIFPHIFLQLNTNEHNKIWPDKNMNDETNSLIHYNSMKSSISLYSLFLILFHPFVIFILWEFLWTKKFNKGVSTYHDDLHN